MKVFLVLCAHEESNLNYGIRNPVSYPLNDGRMTKISKSLQCAPQSMLGVRIPGGVLRG